MKKSIESFLLASRYLMVPLYGGLICYMVLYNISFFFSLIDCIKELFHSGWNAKELSELLKLAAIDSVDSVMIANLILMICLGSQSIFVDEIQSNGHSLPRFLKNMSSGILKLKMASSLVGVTAVHLLSSFINLKTIGWDNLLKESLIHVLFIISAFVFAKIEIMIHPPTETTH